VTTPAIQVLDTEGSAVVHGVSAGLTTDGTELIGVPTTVVAAMRRGTGKTDITGIPDDTALSAAGAAADWVRHLSAQARDWSQWDIVLSAKDGDAQASASPDGVTVALALYSALTGRTFDPSVMVIGNLTESGALAPVGNVISKSDYALSRPEIKTVVVPNNPATAEELGVLSKMKPVIFEGKHIVYAQTMDDVLHDTLDGSRTSARPKPRRAIAAVSRPMQVTPTQAAASVPSVPLPARPHAASAVQDEDPANAELDQWQKMYDRNANAIKSFASQLLHSVGGS
jgi:ATP-dependent Lon protease